MYVVVHVFIKGSIWSFYDVVLQRTAKKSDKVIHTCLDTSRLNWDSIV